MFTGAFQGFEHVIIALCLGFILHRLLNKNKKAIAQEERINRPVDQLDNWDDYLAKLCRISGKNAGELFNIAAQEFGAGISDKTVNQHFRIFISEGELPHYVIRFLKEGKDKIDEINDGPTCKSQDLGMF